MTEARTHLTSTTVLGTVVVIFAVIFFLITSCVWLTNTPQPYSASQLPSLALSLVLDIVAPTGLLITGIAVLRRIPRASLLSVLTFLVTIGAAAWSLYTLRFPPPPAGIPHAFHVGFIVVVALAEPGLIATMSGITFAYLRRPAVIAEFCGMTGMEPSPPPYLEGSPPVAPSSMRLYTVNQVALAAVLGTPIAGAHLIACNERALGNQAASRHALLLGLAVTVGLFGLNEVLPDNVVRLLGIAAVIGVREFARRREGVAIASHLEQGGLLRSSWAAAGVGLLYLVVVILAVSAAVMLYQTATGT